MRSLLCRWKADSGRERRDKERVSHGRLLGISSVASSAPNHPPQKKSKLKPKPRAVNWFKLNRPLTMVSGRERFGQHELEG